MKRIALIGAGSIGIITGALIAKNGYDIEIFDANAANVDALNASGARLSGFLDELVPVTAKLPEQAEGTYDVVVLLTKQVFTRQALAPFLPRMHGDTVVCTLQNGTPEDLVAEVVGRDRTIAGNVMFAAIWKGPGESALASDASYTRGHAFDLGELSGEITERVQEVAQILTSVGRCVITDNISGLKWSKLLMNATFSGLSAALACTFGDLLDDETCMQAALRLMDEAVRAGQAHGLRVEPLEGEPAENLTMDGPTTTEQRLAFFTRLLEVSRPGKASMLQDMEKGIPSERDFIPGRVLELTRRHGLDAPYTELVYELIAESEQRGALPGFEAGRERFAALLAAEDAR